MSFPAGRQAKNANGRSHQQRGSSVVKGRPVGSEVGVEVWLAIKLPPKEVVATAVVPEGGEA